MITNEKTLSAQINGKKGGRPKQDSEIRIELPGINLVILTQSQYFILLDRYGYELIKSAIQILDEWLLSGSRIAEKYIGKNNYAHFRSDGWVVNEARKIINT